MTRLMPLKKNFKKALIEASGEPDRMFQIWANQMSWHHFLAKHPSLSIMKEIPYRVTMFSETYYNRDGKWGNVTLYLDFNWLKGTIESHILPGLPDSVITRNSLWDYEGEELTFPTVEAVPCNPWELPGQRFLENFEFVQKEGEQED